MNAPNFNFDAEGRSDRLPSTTAQGSHSITHHGSHSITHASREAFANFDPAEEQASPNFRKLLFMCLGLALKYRWLILAICALALTVGFIVTFTATPIYQATATIQIDLEAPKVVKFDAPEGRQLVIVVVSTRPSTTSLKADRWQSEWRRISISVLRRTFLIRHRPRRGESCAA